MSRSARILVASSTANGGGRGIRTPDRDLNPYNGLANRRLQPLGHPSAGTRRMQKRLVPTQKFGVNEGAAGMASRTLGECHLRFVML